METSDLTTRILIEIRDEIRLTRTELTARIEETNARIDRTNDRLERLDQRVTHMDLRLSSDIAGLAGAIHDDLIYGRRELRTRIEHCEREIDALKRRG